MSDRLRIEADGSVRILTLDRPDALNAVDHEMHEALADVWSRLAADPGVGAVVLTGAGRAFSAGGDLEWIRKVGGSDSGAEATMRTARRIISAMLDTPLPIVAAVNGPAVGLGCSLTVLSDIVLAAPHAWFADPHVDVGLGAGDGGVLIASHIGMHRAKEFLLLGDRWSSEDAMRAGLVNRVVPADDLLTDATALAHRLAALPVTALRGTKSALNAMLRQHWAAIELGITAEEQSMRSPEHRARLDGLRPPSAV